MATMTALKQVIVCDNECDIREMLGKVVEFAGYQPLLAENMAEVIGYIRTEKPELLLLDIRMPDNDGFDVAELLRRHGNNIPIIFITAHDNLFCRTYSPAVGAVGYLTKPIDVDLLLDRLNAVLSTRTTAKD